MLVSNDGVYNNNQQLISIGHFPEESGMHYLSIAYDHHLGHELTVRDFDDCDNTAMEENMDSDQVSWSIVQTDSSVEMLHNVDLKKQQHGRMIRKRTQFSFLLLPLHIQIMIVRSVLVIPRQSGSYLKRYTVTS